MRTPTLSVCIVLPEAPLAAWQAETVALAARVAPVTSIVRLIGQPGPRGPASVLSAAWAGLDRLLFKKKPDAFAPAPWPLPHIPAAQAHTLQRSRPCSPETAAKLLGEARIILSLAGTAIPDALLAASPLGALAFSFHDQALGALPQAWRAFMTRTNGYSHALVWKRRDLGERLAVATLSPVSPLYYFDTANQACHKAALFPARFLTRLLESQEPEALWNALERPDGETYPSPPGLTDVVRFIPRFAARHLAAAYKDIFYRRQWFLAARPVPQGPPVPPGRADYSGFAPIDPPATAGWADPFPFTRKGRDFVFFETIPMDTGRGAIAVCPIDPSGALGEARTVLSREFHLSYPFVFEWEDEVFMMPESNAGRTLDVYKAVDFPYRWELFRNILNGERVTDATIHADEKAPGRFWLFANKSVPGASNWDELFLYSGSSPLGPWTPHPMNPVVSSAAFSRPAGRLFSVDGRLYRPAQDCVPSYGKRLRIMEVVELAPDGYAERLAATLCPDLIPGSGKLHTLNAGRTLEFTDGFRLISRFTGKPGPFKDI